MKTILDLAKQHCTALGETGDLAWAFLRAHEALREINFYNRIGNDLDSYLFELAEWGTGEIDERPQPAAYGLMD